MAFILFNTSNNNQTSVERKFLTSKIELGNSVMNYTHVETPQAENDVDD